MEPTYEPTDWSRAGSRELQFFATDVEFRQWFDSLPAEYAPYTVWGSRLVKRNRDYEPELFFYPLDELKLALAGRRTVSGAPEQFFLHAAELMPPLPLDREAARRVNAWGSVNGLVLVQHGATRAGQQMASRIAVTDKIKNYETGEVVSLKKRAHLFDALREVIKRKLCFTSIQVFKDGHTEESDFLLMTMDAAKLAAAGHFVRRPGRRIDP